jgi:hypothetical protein
MKKKRKIALLIFIAFAAIATTFFIVKRDYVKFVAGVCLFGVPCGSESDEVRNLIEFVEKNYFVKNPDSVPAEPTVYWRPGGIGLLGQTPHSVIVYNVTDKKEQDHIIELISDYRAKNNLRHIRIEFYREENVKPWIGKDGRRGFKRDKEELIRKVRL